jgi:hypothetical protein
MADLVFVRLRSRRTAREVSRWARHDSTVLPICDQSHARRLNTTYSATESSTIATSAKG